MDDRTLPEVSSLKPEHVQAMVSSLSDAFKTGTAHQAEGVRMQVDGQVRLAEIERARQLDLAHLSDKQHRRGTWATAAAVGALLSFGAALVVAGLITGREQLVTHTVTAMASAAAGWFAGRAKR